MICLFQCPLFIFMKKKVCLIHYLFFLQDLDTSLLPIRVGQSTLDLYSAYLQREMSKELHDNAVKYLRQALHSTPSVLAALLPLIQVFENSLHYAF